MRHETTPLPPTLSSAAQNAARKILALRQLTRETGTKTTKPQNAILQSLSVEVLTEVAEFLAGLNEDGVL